MEVKVLTEDSGFERVRGRNTGRSTASLPRTTQARDLEQINTGESPRQGGSCWHREVTSPFGMHHDLLGLDAQQYLGVRTLWRYTGSLAIWHTRVTMDIAL